VAGLVWAGLAWAWSWSRQQYFVGEQDGAVVIFRGLNTEVAGLDLSEPYETTDVQVDRLSSVEADRVAEGIAYGSLADAEAKVQDLAAGQEVP
jgi:protein phosphatase